MSEIARKYTHSATSRRANTHSYYLPHEQGRPPHEVCKTYFEDTLQICDGKITTVLKKKALTGTLEPDKRGRHTPHNKTDAISEEYVCNFIKSFPAYVSHYGRAKNGLRKFLSPDLNMAIMYRMYKGKCQESNMKPVSLFVFWYIFNTKFNLHFHKIGKDTCQKCDGYKAKIDAHEDGQAKEALITEQELHHRKADAVRNKMMKNIE